MTPTRQSIPFIIGCGAMFSGECHENCHHTINNLFGTRRNHHLIAGGCLQFSELINDVAQGEREFAFKQLDLLIQAQGAVTTEVILLPHSGCLYPKVRFNKPLVVGSPEERDFHVDQTIKLYQELSRRHPSLEFKAYFMAYDGNAIPIPLNGQTELELGVVAHMPTTAPHSAISTASAVSSAA